MKVELINYTRNALETLLFTKDTRLQGGQSIEDIAEWPMEKKLEHLEYMRDTIQSSWEFVDYTFKISGVTRAFTHQLVRTRTASFAQESQRTVDARSAEFVNPSGNKLVGELGEDLLYYYADLIDQGVPIQDARGILPTNVTTSIIIKCNLRTLHDMGLLRLCTRTQGEYQKVFKMMLDCITLVHPWAEQFIRVHCAWYGTCAFPNYKECPVKEYVLAPSKEFKEAILYRWENVDHEAEPIAKDGKTQ